VGRLCTICSHPERQAIDAALLVHEAGYRDIGRRFGVEKDALYAHAHTHLAEQIREHKELAMLASSESLMAELNRLHTYATWALDRAKASDDARTVLAGVDVAGRNVERLAKLGPVGEIEQRLLALEAAKAHEEGGADVEQEAE
jgi:hypothetical protein